MATLTPSNPRGLLEQAANNVSAIQATFPEDLPMEVSANDLPSWALDPQEREDPHESQSTDGKLYESVPVQYRVYLMVESGPKQSDKASARQTLDTILHDYLTEVTTVFRNAGSKVEKTQRDRVDVEGASTRLVDAITFEVPQLQVFE